MLSGGVEPALGGALLAPLRNDAGGVGSDPRRDLHHFARRRHFEVEGLGDARLEPGDIGVADVAAVLAQMRGDAVGAGGDGELGRPQRIGMAAAARIPHGGDVIDVDAEAQMRGRAHAASR